MGLIKTVKNWLGFRSESVATPITDIPQVTGLSSWLMFFGGLGRSQYDRRSNTSQTNQAPLDYNRCREIARALETYNPYAQGILSGLRTYVLGKGFDYKVVSKPGRKSEYVTKAQAIIDNFYDLSCWWDRERELYNRSHRDGEYLTRFFITDDIVQVRVVEPECLVAPTAEPVWSDGVLNADNDVETVLAYWDSVAEEEIPAEEVYHCKLNVDRAVKRGMSDFASTAEIIEEGVKVVKRMLTSEAFRQSIVYFRKYAEAEGADIDEMIRQNKDYAVTGRKLDGTPKTYNVMTQEGVGIEDIPDNMDLASVPEAKNLPGTIEAVQAGLRAVGVRYHMPEGLVSGDASNNNFASSLSAEHPWVRQVEDEQWVHCRHMRKMMLKVLYLHAQMGEIPEEALYDLDVTVTGQHPIVGDKDKETDRRSKLFVAGVISKETWAAEEGYDLKEEIMKGARPQESLSQANTTAEVPRESSNGTAIANGRSY